MKRFLLSLFVLCSLNCFAFAADKNTVLIHPGETIYVRFETRGKKIRVASASTEPNESAQVIFTLDKKSKEYLRTLKVENKFPSDFVYKAEIRSLSLNHQARGRPTPVVANKVAFDEYPIGIEEIAFYDFKLEQ